MSIERNKYKVLELVIISLLAAFFLYIFVKLMFL